MAGRRPIPRVPAGVGAAGKALWRAILGDLAEGWELDARELHLLAEAARCADRVAGLEAVVDREGVMAEGSKGQVVVHPAVVEVRQLRLAQLRLLAALELEDPAAVRARATPAAKRARRAAEARWGRKVELA